MTIKIKTARQNYPNFKKECIDFIIKWWSLKAIAKKYNVRYIDLEKYINSKWFKNIEYKWIKYRRCNVCNIYREMKDFYKYNHWYYTSACKQCELLKWRNRYRIKANVEWDKFLQKMRDKRKRFYEKYKLAFNVRRNTRRRIKNILDNKFRILKKWFRN